MGTDITIEYIELADVGTAPYTDGMFSYGTLEGYSNISTYIPPMSVEQIKVRAPLDHETQNLIRSKQDYANRIHQIVPAAIDADYYPLTPTFTQITYLKNDFTLLTPDEETEVKGLLEKERFFGTPLPDIVKPRREVALLNIQMKLNTKYKSTADINLDVENILASYYDDRLGSTFNTYDLERKIESLSYVKYARVSHYIDERKPNTLYQLGHMISHDGQVYMASKVLGLSGAYPVDWNTAGESREVDIGAKTEDGNLTWRAYKKLPNMPSNQLEERNQSNSNGYYFGIGDFVYDNTNAQNYMFKCTDITKMSGFTVPDLSYAEPGTFVIDGQLVWVTKEYSESYDDWQSATPYELGVSVNVPSSSALSLECVSYAALSSSVSEINFERPQYDVVGKGTNYFEVEGSVAYYFRGGEMLTAVYAENTSSYQIVSATYNSGTRRTTITVSRDLDDHDYEYLVVDERGTRDGQVLWSLVEDPTNVTYPWNSYVTFKLLNDTVSIIP